MLQDSLFPSFILSLMCDGVISAPMGVKCHAIYLQLTRNYNIILLSLCII